MLHQRAGNPAELNRANRTNPTTPTPGRSGRWRAAKARRGFPCGARTRHATRRRHGHGHRSPLHDAARPGKHPRRDSLSPVEAKELANGRAAERDWLRETGRRAFAQSLHEPDPLIPSFSPSGGGEGARRAVEGDSDWFRVPMHGKNGVGAFHERSVLSPGFSRSGPPEGGTPTKWRHTPMQSIKVGRLSMLTPKRSPEGHL